MDIKIDNKTIVVFDLDDTIYNELDYLKSAYCEIAKTVDLNNWKLLYTRLMSLYRSGNDVFNFISETYGTPKEALIQTYREHIPDISLFDGALQLMMAIKEKQGKIGILTDGRSLTQRNKVKALGLNDIVDLLVISEDLGTEKPHQNNYLIFEENFGSGKYYYIADNYKKDFITPNKLGWETIGLVDNGKNIHFDTFKFLQNHYLPKHMILSLKEISAE